jgi:MFS family permease
MLSGAAQSPRWLAAKGRSTEARAALDRLGVDPAQASAMLQQPEAGTGLSWRRHRKPILLAVTLAAFNQLSGINAILYYLNDIFAAAGFAKVSADLQAVAIGATNLLFTLIAMTVIDRVGRKTLLLIGSVGTAASLAAAAFILSSGTGQQWLLAVLVIFIAAFAFSQGAVIWVYLSEIFPTPVRARGQALGSGVHWLFNAAISFVFPLVAARAKGAPFVPFAAMMALQFVVVLMAFPETKGVALEDMEGALQGRKAAGDRAG